MILTVCVCALWGRAARMESEFMGSFIVICSETLDKERPNERIKCRNPKTSDSIVCGLCKSAAVLQGFASLCWCTDMLMKGRVGQRYRDLQGVLSLGC